MALNGSGFLSTTVVAGAGQFTGLAGAGLVVFDQLGGPQNNMVPRILAVGYSAAGVPHEVNFHLAQAAGVAQGGERIRIGGSQIQADGSPALTNEASVVCCGGLLVPRDDALFGPYWVLACTTSGKTGDGTLSVWYDMGVPVGF